MAFRLQNLVSDDFLCHDLRRCWSACVKGDMVSRQQGMGHSSIMMTAAYTVPLEDEMKRMYSSFQMWESEDKIIEFPLNGVL